MFTVPDSDSPLPCPLWRRLLALLYDLLIVVAIVMAVGLLCQLATGGQLIRTAGHAVIPAWYRPLQALVVSAYFISSWLLGGQTVGMRPWRIRLTRSDGGRPTLQQAVLRLLVAAAPLLALMLAPTLGMGITLWTLLAAWAVWFAVALADPRRRALHDIVAATELRGPG
ncbi:MAG: RDD family protein [Rhodanobacter sp.]|nr:MAG: RDD family protein [Rhodanobacter sp.]TAL98936.1 MAG: RDD family protein [Rhodanobacter sp.]TAM39288.1 MAG: RDD family protein [Rhodanobacter sp.]TAN28721.1 MAG: RDD family protein [Rhodanobacter sp.]